MAGAVLPLVFALAGATLLLAGVAAQGAQWAAGLATCGLAASAWQWRRARPGPLPTMQGPPSKPPSRVGVLWAAAAPLWMRQIESARREGDEQVAQLARRFGELARRLDRVLGEAPPAQHEALGVLSASRIELDRLVAALRAEQQSKAGIVEEIRAAAARLRESAAEMREVALLTRMVSLNATIEAARAGPAGRAFGVVVADMRQLAVRTASASEQFSRQMDALHALVTSVVDGQPHATGGVAWAGELVHGVTSRVAAIVGQLSASVETLAVEGRQVREDVAHVLVALQFQDRVSQILAHVGASLRGLVEEAGEADATGDREREFLQREAAAYSTPEEFANFGSPVATGKAITYFPEAGATP